MRAENEVCSHNVLVGLLAFPCITTLHLTLPFSTTLVSQHLPTPSPSSKTLAPIAAALDHVPFPSEHLICHSWCREHRGFLFPFLLPSSQTVSPLLLPLQVPAPGYPTASTGQWNKHQPEQSRKLSPRPGGCSGWEWCCKEPEGPRGFNVAEEERKKEGNSRGTLHQI